MQALIPARIDYTPGGIPYSAAFDDVYHSTRGALGQATHVYLGGNRLPGRWQGRPDFTILETGFGLGVNFLATWRAWRQDPSRTGRLHFVSIEAHPLPATDLRAVHERLFAAHPDLLALSAALVTRWPPALPGLHRIELAGGQVVLTLGLGDITRVLPRLALRADAFYFDGFAPAKNPRMWERQMFVACAKLARPDATFATYTSATEVRQALGDAGYEAHRVPGYAGKYHMLVGTLVPRRGPVPAPATPPDRHALVIGAGLAGCAVTESLAARGWRVTLIDREPHAASGASGNPAGTFHPVVSRDDNHLARLTRAAFLLALQRWRALTEAGHDLRWASCGALQVPGAKRRGAGLPSGAGWPADYVRNVDAAEATALTGVELKAGGLWFASGGWIDPASLCQSLLDAAGPRVTRIFASPVARCVYDGSVWTAQGANGHSIASAPVLVLANALEANQVVPGLSLPLRGIRGQLTYLPVGQVPGLHACVCGNGYLMPPSGGRGGQVVAGATYDLDDIHAAANAAGHADNLRRIGDLLGTPLPALDPADLEGRAAIRAVTPDRLPLIGALPQPVVEQTGRTRTALARLPRLPHAFAALGFASRGILWSGLAGEIIAAMLEGEPCPIESDLLRAVDPARFIGREIAGAGLAPDDA